MTVTVHSLGAVERPPAKIVLRDRAGKVLATAQAAPTEGAARSGAEDARSSRLRFRQVRTGRVEALPSKVSGKLPEITQMNNRVQF